MAARAGRLPEYGNGKAVEGNTSTKGIPWMCATLTCGIGWRSTSQGSKAGKPKRTAIQTINTDLKTPIASRWNAMH